MITAAEERDLIVRAKAGDTAAAGELIRAHNGYLHMLVKRVGGRGDEIEDRMQEARMAAIHVLKDYDPDKGARFMTFAARGVIWHLQRFRDASGLVRVPRPCNFKRINPVLQQRATRARRGPSEIPLGMFDRANVLDDVARNESADRVRLALKTLSEREQAILSARLDGQTLKEIGCAIGVTRERVRQLETRALAKIEKHLMRGAIAARRRAIGFN